MPAATFARQAGRGMVVRCGSAAAATVYVIVDGWASNGPTARTLADTMRAALDGYRAATLSWPV